MIVKEQIVNNINSLAISKKNYHQSRPASIPMKRNNGRGKAGGSASASKKSKGTSLNPSNAQSATSKNGADKKPKRKDGMLLINLIIGMVSVMTALVAISVVSNSDQLGVLTVYPQGNMDMIRGPPPPGPAGYSVTNAAELARQQQQARNGHMFAQARSTDDPIASVNGSPLQVPLEGRVETEVLSMDPNLKHVHFIQSPNVIRQIPVSEFGGSRIGGQNGHPRESSYTYYYYDSFTQSFHLQQEYTTFPEKSASFALQPYQKSLSVTGRYHPTVCKDGQTYGYSDWFTLRNAVHELSNAYKYSVSRWGHYNAAMTEYEMIKFMHESNMEKSPEKPQELTIEPPPHLPQHLVDLLDMPPDPFAICPHATLRSQRNLPIHIDAEDVIIECDSCVIDVSGTHFSFGSNAKNVVVRGLTLMGATASSLTFHRDGAEANFEDCYWVNNQGAGVHGAVADMNSTSSVNFFRCEISDAKQSPPRPFGTPGMPTGFVSSLTMRSGN